MTNISEEQEAMLLQDSYGALPSDVEIGSLAELAKTMEAMEDYIKKCERHAKETKEKLNVLAQETLPRKMLELGIPGIDLPGGRRVQIDNIIAAKMPKKEDTNAHNSAISWLDRHDLGDIVKREVVCSFGKESEEQTKRVLEELKRITNGQVPVFERQDVHYQTLNATLKEQARKGQPLPSPEDGFDIYVGPRAKLIRPK